MKKKKPHKLTKNAVSMAIIRSTGEIDYEVRNRKKKYYITKKGEDRLFQETKSDSTLGKKSTDIVNNINKIKNKEEKEYFKEALACYNSDAYRGAVVLTWIVCIWHLYKKIEQKGFKKFNQECQTRYNNSKKKKVKKRADLQYYADSEILLLCEDLGIIDRNLRKELETHLDLRNHCAHPGNYKVGENKVINFFEDIINNVLKL